MLYIENTFYGSTSRTHSIVLYREHILLFYIENTFYCYVTGGIEAPSCVCSVNVDVQLSSTWFKKIIFYFVLIAASSVNVELSATWSKSKVLASAQSSKNKEKNQRAGMSSV
jgi:hypothetical protein